MNEKTFNLLGIVAAVMVVLSVVVGSWKPNPDFDNSAARYLVQDLSPNDIGAIEVKNGEDSARLVRSGKNFLVASKHNYPASNKEINSLISKCLKIRTSALVTEDADDHAGLHVVDGGEETQVLKFFDREDKPMLSLYVAPSPKSDEMGGGGFSVRLDGDDKVFHTDEWISFRGKGLDYVDKSLVEIPRDDTARVDVNTPAGVYTILSPEKGKIELQDVPEGQKVKGTSHESVFGAVSYLTLTDFLSEAEVKGLKFDSSYTVETRAKAVYTFEIAQKKEAKEAEGDAEPEEETKYFVRCRARYVGGDVMKPKDDDPQEELDRKEALLLAQDACALFNQQHQSWVYEISSWKAEQMVKPKAELLEEDDGKPEEVAASHILISYAGSSRSEATRTKEEAKARAEEVLQKVKDGGDFAELAKEYSDGPSGPDGGDLGTFKFDKMAKPFSEAAFALEVDAISDVVETEFGFHVIKRTK